jgi:hypothetical protein
LLNKIKHLLVDYFLALIIYECNKIYSYGFRNYLLSSSNMINAMAYIIYIGSYSMKYYTMIKVSLEVNNLNSLNFWNTINTLEPGDYKTQQDIYQTFYWLNSGIVFLICPQNIRTFLGDGLFFIFTRPFLLVFVRPNKRFRGFLCFCHNHDFLKAVLFSTG